MNEPAPDYPLHDDGLGRARSALLAAIGFGLLGALAGYWVDQLCFHNMAGVEVATADSERGPWCEAIAGGASWSLFIGFAAVLGLLAALIPVPRAIRVALYVLLATLVVAAPIYLGRLDYTVPI